LQHNNETMCKNKSTEETIRDAARRVFIAKGFAGCSSREIAKEAGMNVALVNYYFRSKNQLFQLIFHAAMEDFFVSMLEVFAAPMDLEEKLKIFISNEYDFFAKHPEIPRFIISELTREGCEFDEKAAIKERIEQTGIFQEALQAQEAGRMRKIDFFHIMILIMSNCQYPFMARPLIQQIHEIPTEAYQEKLALHKELVIDMVMSYLFPKNKN
jgi:TetR/AcrR family transcriptional regulator